MDALIEKVEQAASLEELQTAARALDRVLLWEHFTVPQYHVKGFRLVHWDKFHKPATPASYDMGVSTWWAKELGDSPEPVSSQRSGDRSGQQEAEESGAN